MSTTYGHDDPAIPRAAQLAHDAALARDLDGYVDESSGCFVYTTRGLLKMGRCCGCSCRHCPYTAEEQRTAGRGRIRPSS